MGHFKGVAIVTSYIELDTNEADGVGEFHNLIRNTFEHLKELPRVKEIHSKFRLSELKSGYTIKREETECADSLILLDENNKLIEILDDGGR